MLCDVFRDVLFSIAIYLYFLITGRRVVPIIDPELRKKAEKAVAAKEKKAEKKALKLSPEVVVERDEFDDALDVSNKSLSEKLGLSPPGKGASKKGKKAAKKPDGMKQTKLNFASKKASDDESLDEFDMAIEQGTLRYLFLPTS